LESSISGLKDEIKNLKQQYNELTVPSNVDPEEEMKDKQKLDLIVKRDQEMSSYIDRFEEVSLSPSRWLGSLTLTEQTRGKFLADTQNTKALIVGLLEHIGRGLDDATNLPDADVLGMTD
jgi:hypothetical protein